MTTLPVEAPLGTILGRIYAPEHDPTDDDNIDGWAWLPGGVDVSQEQYPELHAKLVAEFGQPQLPPAPVQLPAELEGAPEFIMVKVRP